MLGLKEAAASNLSANGQDNGIIGRKAGKKPVLPPANCPKCEEKDAIWFDEVGCADCGSIWRPHEPWFSCDACGHKQPARLNTAIVVAQLTLSQVTVS